MAAATLLDLIDWRNRSGQIGRLMNFVRRTVTVTAGRVAFTMRAALDCPLHTAVTFTAAHVIGQGLEIGVLVLGCNIGMAIGAHEVGMCGGCESSIRVALSTIAVLSERQ